MANFSDETVMRYVDGELDDQTGSEIEAAMASDPEFAKRVEMFATTRLAPREALRPMLDEPIPAALQHSVEMMVARARTASQPGVAPSRRRMLTPANDWLRLSAAACVAAVLGGFAGYFAQPEESPRGLQIANVDRAALHVALRTVPTGGEQALQGSDGRIRVIASFHDQQKEFCREVELTLEQSAVTSVVCHRNGDWQLRFAVASPDGPGYAPASASETLDAYLTAIGAGQPLDETLEQQALENLPRPVE